MTARALLPLALAAPLAACATPQAPEPNPPALSRSDVCPETRNWTAHIDAMPKVGDRPGSQPTLIVTGEALAPPGMELSLVPGPLDRMMPPGQRLTLRMTPGRGPTGWQGIRAEIRPAQAKYRAVMIGCDGAEVARIEDIPTAY